MLIGGAQVNARLLRLAGTTAPNNVRDVFWSGRGAVPGARGNAYLFGHTYDSQPSGVGVLDHLKRVHRGQMIKVAKAGKTIRFKVRKTERASLHLSEKKMATLLSRLGAPRMTVTTCLWSKSKGEYVARLIVYAKKIR